MAGGAAAWVRCTVAADAKEVPRARTVVSAIIVLVNMVYLLCLMRRLVAADGANLWICFQGIGAKSHTPFQRGIVSDRGHSQLCGKLRIGNVGPVVPSPPMIPLRLHLPPVPAPPSDTNGFVVSPEAMVD